MFFQKLIKPIENKKGVALFLVLASMATLAIFVGEITYTAAINQKLAYDRLDQIKAHALAKSGLRLALLRIRAYSEIKKTVADSTAGKSEEFKAAANNMMPKGVMEKIWSEPITIPFSGDLSALPSAARDGITKFRKDSGMEGKLYISIEAQSSKFNLNTLLPTIAATPTPTPKKKNTGTTGAETTDEGEKPEGDEKKENTDNSDTTKTDTSQKYDAEKAREQLLEQLKTTFANKAEDSPKFRDQYRNYRLDDLAQEIIGWADLSYDTLRSQQSIIPFKLAPYYDISELHYLPSMDDEIYNLISPQFIASTSQGLNVNAMNDFVLRSLVPLMTAEERKEFFEFRDVAPPDDNHFKTGEDFLKYLSEKVAAFKGSKTKIDDLKTALTQRGIVLVTDESHFKVKIEATVQQTKRTLEAWVSVLPAPTRNTSNGRNQPNQPNPSNTQTGTNANQNGNFPSDQNNSSERSNLKITQLRVY